MPISLAEFLDPSRSRKLHEMDLLVAETLRSQPIWVLLCFSLGTLSTLKFSLRFLQSLYVFLLRPAKNLVNYGQWAVITGPTDGIGKAMAFQLARQGLNLVLVGRNPQKLDQVSAELTAKSPATDLKTVVVDFAGDLSEGMKNLEEAMKDIDVGILLNNAGIVNEQALFLHEMEEDQWERIVRVNLVAPTVVAAAVLPGMIQRGRGAIINLGSAATTVPSYPLYSVYASTKAYILQLSKSLHNEYKLKGIHVQCQMPWLVATNMVPSFSASFFVASPSQHAHSAVRAIGYGVETIPYWTHVLQTYLQQCLPDSVMNGIVYGSMMGMRKEKRA